MDGCSFTLIIPSLDPDEKLKGTVESAIEAGIDDIILVDDGSRAENRHRFTELESAHPEVTLLQHQVNLGKGAALKTAFSYFLGNREGKCGVVTADGDGQHKTEDIIACADVMERGIRDGESPVVLGCRNFGLEDVPARSRFGNRATSLVFRLFCGMKVSDTQTGLRAIPREHMEAMLGVSGTRYEYETNMLLYMGEKGIPYREVEISTVYFDDNRASHFRPLADSVRVWGLILKFFASSLSSSVVDLLAFYLLGELLFSSVNKGEMLFITVAARLISMTVNFSMNRSFVFGSREGVGKTLFRYVCLAVPIMLASWGSVYLISEMIGLLIGAGGINGISHIARTLIKLPVDVILFLISFRVQRKWVFNDKK